jgi:GDP-D-mannose 3',5'-epimerase
MCRHYLEELGLQVRIARYHNVYGPLGPWDGAGKKALAVICRKVAAAKLSDHNEIEIWGDGQQGRNFIYLDDCVEGTLRLVEYGMTDPITIGSSHLFSIDELVDIVEEIAGLNLKRRYVRDAPQGIRDRTSDNTRIGAVLGWEPTSTLEQTYGWIHDQLTNGMSDRGTLTEGW